jgi:hypothetical protein
LHLFYGPEFFAHFGRTELWNDLISWLVQWKSELPDLPDVNLLIRLSRLSLRSQSGRTNLPGFLLSVPRVQNDTGGSTPFAL